MCSRDQPCQAMYAIFRSRDRSGLFALKALCCLLMQVKLYAVPETDVPCYRICNKSEDLLACMWSIRRTTLYAKKLLWFKKSSYMPGLYHDVCNPSVAFQTQSVQRDQHFSV